MARNRSGSRRQRTAILCGVEYGIPPSELLKIGRAYQKGKTSVGLRKKRIHSSRLKEWQQYVASNMRAALSGKTFATTADKKKAFADEMKDIKIAWRGSMGHSRRRPRRSS